MAVNLPIAIHSPASDGSSNSPHTPVTPSNVQPLDQPNNNQIPSQNSIAAKRKPSRRANTAERRATHNAVERQRRETLNARFLVRPLSNLSSSFRVFTRFFDFLYFRILRHYCPISPKSADHRNLRLSILRSLMYMPLVATVYWLLGSLSSLRSKVTLFGVNSMSGAIAPLALALRNPFVVKASL